MRHRRIVRERVFESLTRKRVYRLVSESPGCTAAEVARSLELSYKTAEHHLRVLVDLRVVSWHLDGRRTRYFAPGSVPVHKRNVAIAGRLPAARAILEAVRGGARTRGETRTRTGLSRSAVRWHVERLIDRGLLHAERLPGGGLLVHAPSGIETGAATDDPDHAPAEA